MVLMVGKSLYLRSVKRTNNLKKGKRFGNTNLKCFTHLVKMKKKNIYFNHTQYMRFLAFFSYYDRIFYPQNDFNIFFIIFFLDLFICLFIYLFIYIFIYLFNISITTEHKVSFFTFCSPVCVCVCFSAEMFARIYAPESVCLFVWLLPCSCYYIC